MKRNYLLSLRRLRIVLQRNGSLLRVTFEDNDRDILEMLCEIFLGKYKKVA